MIMADVFKILFLILGTLIVLVSYWLLFEACAPRIVENCRQRYAQKPWRNLLLGLAVGLPATVLGLVMASGAGALFKFVGIAVLLALVFLGLLGSTGFVRHIGLRLTSPRDAEEPWRRVLRGGTILSLTFVLPFIGWFVVLPYTLITGLGAFLGAWRANRPAPAPAVPAAQASAQGPA